MISTRHITRSDVPALAELLRVNREFLGPWEPLRGDEYFTAAGQRCVVQDALARYEKRTALPHVIVDDAGHQGAALFGAGE
ncbi:hypothetical protein [Arthrobacter sp. H14-L1]|uniref:hypothetical protein n=1 Tax=Arthrobacter sp. H14-L1 TaxID=2996697 RepID=UPI00226EFD6E|nr:hypothetical protein [Arthrobacter sp. H14-L1]